MLIECANCGAPLDVSGNASLVTCNYCSGQNRVKQTRTMSAQTPQGWKPPPNWTPPAHLPAQSVQLHYQVHKAGKQASRVGLAVALVAVTSVGGVAYGVLSGVGGAGLLGLRTGVGSGGVTPFGEHLQWHSHGEPPMPVDLNADGVEDVVGFYQLLDDGKSIVHLGAFNGKDFERIWKTPALGTLQDQSHAVVSGGFVGVTDSNNQLRVFEAASGKPKAALQLSDKAKRICADPKQPGSVWVEQVDDAHQWINLREGSKQPAPRPAWCPKDVGLSGNSACWNGQFRRKNQSLSTCLSPETFAKSDGFEAEYVMAEADSKVGIGKRHPGTATPMAVGYSADGAKVLWTRNLAAPTYPPKDGAPQLADLLDAQAVFQYEPKAGGARLAAFEAGTGKALWDVPVPRSGDGSQASTFRVTHSRVYVPHWTWLDIFDVKTGAHLGTIGIW